MTRWLCTLGIAVAVVVGTTNSGCGGGSPPIVAGMIGVGDINVEFDIVGVHAFGETSCPQPVGTFVLTNGSSGRHTVYITETSSQLDMFLYDPETDSEIPWTPQELGPGASIEVHFRFNCSSTADISTTVMVRARDATGSESQSIPFSLDIQGAP